jgi:ADP-L-glycero-D-manno-heptose 6-epimerase
MLAGHQPLVGVDLTSPPGVLPGVQWCQASVADQVFFDNIRSLRPSVIVHLASVTNTMIWDHAQMLDRNVGDFERIIEAAETCGARVVFASSSAVYGNGPVPMLESQEPQPHNPYALSKCMMEQRAAAARDRGLSVLALRFFNVYGPGEAHKRKSASMVFQLYRALISGKPVRVFRDGEQSRDFIYVDDVAAAVRTAVNSGAQGVVNVGTGEPTSFNKLIAVLAAATMTEPRIEYLDEPSWEFQRHTCASPDLAGRLLGLRPRPLAAGIPDFIRHTDPKLR